MTRILITGGGGYIGSILVPRLLEVGYDVVVLDNFMYRQQSLTDCCIYPELSVVRGDARDERLMRKLIKGVDFILPLAAIVGEAACDRYQRLTTETNYDAIRLLLKCRTHKQGIIFPNTNSGYGCGRHSEKPLHCNESSPLKPVSLYGKTKCAAERILLNDGNAISLRLATVFGISPKMRTDLLVNDFVYRAMTDGFVALYESHYWRNFVYIGDVARAFLHCLDHYDTMVNEPYNVGHDKANLSKRELCLKIAEHIPEFKFVAMEGVTDPDKRNYIVSNEKMKRRGFEAQTTLDEGIRELMRGYGILRKNQFTND